MAHKGLQRSCIDPASGQGISGGMAQHVSNSSQEGLGEYGSS
jgi:hypothetical protein